MKLKAIAIIGVLVNFENNACIYTCMVSEVRHKQIHVSTSLYVSFLLPLYVNICVYFNKLKKNIWYIKCIIVFFFKFTE